MDTTGGGYSQLEVFILSSEYSELVFSLRFQDITSTMHS